MEDAPKLIVPYGPRVAWLCTSHVMSSCHYAAKDPRQLKREQVIIQLIIVLNFVMIDEDMFKDITAAKARFDLSLYSFLGWGVQNPNSEPALSTLYNAALCAG